MLKYFMCSWDKASDDTLNPQLKSYIIIGKNTQDT